MRLHYLGPKPAIDAALPLPEGWPAADHDEPDPAIAAAKLASGLYAERSSRGNKRRADSEPDQEVTDAGDPTTA